MDAYVKAILFGGLIFGSISARYSSWIFTLLTAMSTIVVLFIVSVVHNIQLVNQHDADNIKVKPKRNRNHSNHDDAMDDDIPDKVKRKYEGDIAKLMTYDPLATDSIHMFQPIKNNTECTFAKHSKLWGSCDWNERLSLEENITRSIPMFIKFTAICSLRHLDGFVFQLPGEQFGDSIEVFGDSVRRVLTVLSDNDPAGYHCMNKSFIGKKGWCFEFNRETFFITTFAPLYPETSSRFNFGSPHSFILFQPEISFWLHSLPKDTPHTNWESPKTVRDRIRIAYKKSGREYLIRDTLIFPVVHDILPAVNMNGALTEWWVRKENDKGKQSKKASESSCPFLKAPQS
ncbi:uncharacterized protein LOC100369553 [Saccoglossus kowalevskii]|uniref:Uncharacterized protein LOC100369553 n=1 Tax=Saccoglossus kowalevskii TaxID=10224 RepID=A0ABM0GJD8_SACKO|nr:PREDICTED: uncharacterized protein LOC100369553 [Saccoglossus kowalevskii]